MGVTLATEKKQPLEIRSYGMDFTNALDTGDAITGQSVFVYDANRTDVSATMIVPSSVQRAGNVVRVLIQGGTDGSKYNITFRATTMGGELLEEDVKITVKEL